ncbi:ROK family protein [Nocardioides speluncae]|uniref:ROK family protein n=1 Tax=Nocardioides speluncae TaxID=2670337 RepID=UPI000D69B2A9|nr:ROK family protein [Nocardioides speluncae]
MTTGGSLGSLRAANRAALLRAIESAGSLSRADLMRATGLSRTAVSSLVGELLSDRLVVEREERGTPHRGVRGRPPVLLELASNRGAVLAIDVGHSHMRLALARLDASILDELQLGFAVDDQPAETLDRLADQALGLLDNHNVGADEVRGVGLGIPGPVDRDGRMTSSILPHWRGLQPGAELERRTGLAAHVENDAHMGALGELAFGAAHGVSNAIYVKAATGLGAGIIADGSLIRGATGIAGELGHVQVDPAGKVCRCGSRGCLETFVSGPQLVQLLQPTHDRELTVELMLALAEGGDMGADRLLADAGRSIGRVLADLCNVLNPERIVIGGTLGASTTLITGVREAVDRHAQPSASAAVTVVGSQLGERAEVMGALALALART